MSNPLPSYGKIYNLGHRAVRDLFTHEVRIQEKVDGSQFSFGVRNGQLHMRSKRVEIHAGSAITGQFMMAVKTVCELFDDGKLIEGWTYRGEAITKPRHNHLTYERIPAGGVILFDIDKGQEDFMDHDLLVFAAKELGLEVVPEYDVGKVSNIEGLNELLNQKSCLGGEKNIEGIVMKPTGPVFDEHTGKLLRAKLVAVEFKETQTSSWKAANPNRNDVVKQITEGLTTEARWRKACQALADDGEMTHSPKDIGPLLGRIQQDIFEEEGERIKQALFKHFWKTVISRGVTRGFPEWYKAQLLELQSFGDDEEE